MGAFGRPGMGADSGTGILDSTVTVPVLGTINAPVLFIGIGLLALTLFSGEGKAYSKAKTAGVRSAIHGAKLRSRAKAVDARKKKLRAAERKLEALQAS